MDYLRDKISGLGLSAGLSGSLFGTRTGASVGSDLLNGSNVSGEMGNMSPEIAQWVNRQAGYLGLEAPYTDEEIELMEDMAGYGFTFGRGSIDFTASTTPKSNTVEPYTNYYAGFGPLGGTFSVPHNSPGFEFTLHTGPQLGLRFGNTTMRGTLNHEGIKSIINKALGKTTKQEMKKNTRSANTSSALRSPSYRASGLLDETATGQKTTSMDKINAYVDKISRQASAQFKAQSPFARWSGQMTPMPSSTPSLKTQKTEPPIAIGKASRFNRAEDVESKPERSTASKPSASPTSYASAFETEKKDGFLGGLPALDGEVEVGVTKDSQLEEHAVSKAQHEELAREEMAQAVESVKQAGFTPMSKEDIAASWGFARASAHARRSSDDGDGGRTGGPSHTTENYNGSGTPGYEGKDGYVSGRTSKGNPTGGVKLDEQGREVGAHGQFTRDTWGYKDNPDTPQDESAQNTRVICTELVRQGLMQAKLQRLDIAFTFRHLCPATVRGYHFWAVPYVRLMKRSSFATRLVEPFARWRAEEIAYQMGARDKPNFKGKLVRLAGEPICWALGMVLGWTGDPDRFYPLGAKS